MENKELICILKELEGIFNCKDGEIILEDESLIWKKVNKQIGGFINIVFEYAKGSIYLDSDDLQRAAIRQWIEYCLIYILPEITVNTDVLKDLDQILLTRTYLVSHKITIADIILYHMIYNTVNNLKRGNWINIFRWFDNLQQDSLIRQSKNIINLVPNL